MHTFNVKHAIAAALLSVATLTSVACPKPLSSGGGPRPVRDLIRDNDAAMAAVTSYRVDATASFDVNVLPSVGHITAHMDVVKPDSYLEIKAGGASSRSLVRSGRTYTWDDSSGSWVEGGSAPSFPGGTMSQGAQTGILLGLETLGNFDSLASDRSGTELLRYRLKADRVSKLTSTILGLIVPEASGILDFASLDGNIDFDFYLDSSTHRIDEIVVNGNVSAINIPVRVGGSIKYTDYNSKDITLPSPGGGVPSSISGPRGGYAG